MTYVFVSNYYNHHQAPISKAMSCLTGDKYTFIETQPMESGRKNLGWGVDNYPPYVLQSYISNEAENECIKLINDADVVIFGSAPKHLIKKRLSQGKLIFRYSERIFKEKFNVYELPARVLVYYFRHGRYKNVYLLCASAYTSADYAKTHNYLSKSYKWGYFPEVKKYDNIDKLINDKSCNSILWVGRFLEWKHPEASLEVAKRIKEAGYSFELNIIGNGIMETKLQKMVEDYNLQDCVHMLGSMSPDMVRQYMEKSKILMFTSDFYEGWGAVLNEAMNSGCAVVASHAIGSVPYLIKHTENGLIYKNDDIDNLYENVKVLLDNPIKQQDLGHAAYKTMLEQWNAVNAAERFIKLAETILDGNKSPDLFSDGVCSRANIIKNDWWTGK